MEVFVWVLVGFILVLMVILLLVIRQSGASIDLKQASEHLLTLAEQRFRLAAQAGTADLDTKKQLIDQQVQAVKTELEKVTTLAHGISPDSSVVTEPNNWRMSELSSQGRLSSDFLSD